jgi:hypothetical protein
LSEVLSLYLLPILASISFIVVVIVITLSLRNREVFKDILSRNDRSLTRNEERNLEITPTDINHISLQTDKQLKHQIMEDVEKIKQELKILQVEREIVGYALAHLYEAEADGKIVEKDRLRLVERYKKEMHQLDTVFEKKQMIIRLHDLEETRSTLVEMFHSKIDEISNNINEINIRLGIPSTTQMMSKQSTKTASIRAEETAQKDADQAKGIKSEAKEKLETVQEEVLKILERLEQIETEG